jgi:hypothetical protein
MGFFAREGRNPINQNLLNTYQLFTMTEYNLDHETKTTLQITISDMMP